tara:strand:- start:11 stop:535 length:525 start_codon:yes stop_codon:yes gene_type:complete
MNLDPENVPWQIAMLIGMLGDSTDIPHLLKIWKDLGMYENSSIWLGAMRRLYWKSRGPDPRTPFLKRIEIKFAEDLAESEIYKKKLNLFFEVENPTNSPRFIRLSANFWHTITDENIPSKYFWIPAGGRIESNIKTHIYPSFHTENIRMDIKIWEIGVSKTINHHTEEISFPFK